ncbi:hypothetical protein JX265_004739 [Neoarthrinium moseri]|uniref:Conidiation-specific protein 8 n=1 Tax=Neoarthrinium moseri TaxID=1658444 RepID=A0A9P9WPS3_9PEZI|nr:uncharacterized protein JN550_003759 [Neoarthrinium moseri]KAI1840326.1 hypothetical protein JX266_013458 [Neoarthrinium moseri]KAI1872885.1 hypothetical protein JN550_003759 [Neoarthrinium moseri]KAI1874531.1 hypothetical protein JX265_004739 [Neoarthrinium moseri]
MDSSKVPDQANNFSKRRRSSGPAFDGLMNQKRSSDPMSQARRQSLQEQKPAAGIFGQMWHNFTRGPSSPSK